MDIVLLGGLWLPVEEWDEVVAALQDEGHRGVPVLLPGQGDGNRTATLDDQLTAVLVAVDECEGKPLVVGHSASSALAWMAADARPDKVGGVVLIGGFPVADGGTYADFFPVVDGAMPFPGWEPFEGPDSVDLDQATRDRLSAAMIPVPERRQPRGGTAHRRSTVRGAGHARLPRVLAGAGEGVDGRRRGSRAPRGRSTSTSSTSTPATGRWSRSRAFSQACSRRSPHPSRRTAGWEGPEAWRRRAVPRPGPPTPRTPRPSGQGGRPSADRWRGRTRRSRSRRGPRRASATRRRRQEAPRRERRRRAAEASSGRG
jgi:pimeloyl-ACP methyl ester carboxylesterase